ncbi:MAG: hypothetical protein K0U98_27380 [Deltaproteobacteria bacterium]|nr:hypothetical protein [Deltaproteobacteria bacterium]
MTGELVGIFTSARAGEAMEPLTEAVLETGKGLVGDRYYHGVGTFSEKLEGTPDVELTLVEEEEVFRFNEVAGLGLGLGDLRRNLVTRGVRLNDLVGKRFQVGGVQLKGIRLCEPCAHLSRLVEPSLLPGMRHRAGLRAQIVSGGPVRLGNEIAVIPKTVIPKTVIPKTVIPKTVIPNAGDLIAGDPIAGDPAPAQEDSPASSRTDVSRDTE